MPRRCCSPSASLHASRRCGLRPPLQNRREIRLRALIQIASSQPLPLAHHHSHFLLDLTMRVSTLALPIAAAASVSAAGHRNLRRAAHHELVARNVTERAVEERSVEKRASYSNARLTYYGMWISTSGDAPSKQRG